MTPALADVELYGRVGFRNFYKPGEWTPVTLWAVSDVPVSGQLVVDVIAPNFPPARYIQRADIGRKAIPQTIYVLTPERPIGRIDAQFVSQSRTRARLVLTSMRPLNPKSPIVLNYTGNPHAMDVFKDKGLGFSHEDSGLMAVPRLGKAVRSSAYSEAPVSGG